MAGYFPRCVRAKQREKWAVVIYIQVWALVTEMTDTLVQRVKLLQKAGVFISL